MGSKGTGREREGRGWGLREGKGDGRLPDGRGR